MAPDYCCIEGVGKILLNIGIRSFGLVAVILALTPEELLAASERIGGLLLVELAKSLNWVAEGEFEDMEEPIIYKVLIKADFYEVTFIKVPVCVPGRILICV
ncbi:hypothetical protein [Nostoc favosum]|uniref:Uncharacterized protein n=1 Tax=Nostoc favosum CHAB5714 TaxID=2780399 RepID=A0ABS8I134_9NOSO|nr:hypothetical protein [Nostoc favosum]MCC5597957.1 hypothetical protein [Nostoc favosum CHAB5714]